MKAAERAVVSAGRRCGDPELRTSRLLDGLEKAKVPARMSLLGVLARFGGSKALATVEAQLQHANEEVRISAVRSLADWPTPEPAGRLKELAKAGPGELTKILALRGYIRMTGMLAAEKPKEAFAMYKDAFGTATRADEKKLVLAGIQKIVLPEVAAFLEPSLEDPQLLQEANIAYFNVAVGLTESHPDEAQKALGRILAAEDISPIKLDKGETRIIGPGTGKVIAPLEIRTDSEGVTYAVVPTDTDKPVEPGEGGRLVYMFSATEAGKLSLALNIRCVDYNDD
jgi:hypothetical protein